MKVVILAPSGVTAFEVLGPYGAFHRTSEARVHLLGDRAGRVPCHGSKVSLEAEASYLFVEPSGVADVLVVPGGIGIRRLVRDRSVLDWVREANATATWTIGISTGSVLLSAAGVLDGQDATTHWLAEDLLEQQGAHAVTDRLVLSGKVVTATGAVAGLEAALFVISRLRDEDEAAAVRERLGQDMRDVLASNKPVGTDVLSDLAGVKQGEVGPTPFAPGPESARQHSRWGRRPDRPRWSGRAGRIETTDSSPR